MKMKQQGILGGGSLHRPNALFSLLIAGSPDGAGNAFRGTLKRVVDVDLESQMRLAGV